MEISKNELVALVGKTAFEDWNNSIEMIKSKYDMDELWGKGGKAWDIEYKFRKGGKTLCALYAKKDSAGILVIFGQSERDKFENERGQFSLAVQKHYDDAKTFHDGKWVMFPLDGSIKTAEFEQLLLIKRKPNKK